MSPRHVRLKFWVLLLLLCVTACAPAAPAPTATPSRLPPTATNVPPTVTPAPPTATPIPPTATLVPTAIPTADFAPEALLGIWTRSDPERGQLYLTFTAEGKYIAAHGEPTSGVHGGRYMLEGRVLTFVDGWQDCDTGSYVLNITPGQALIMRALADRSCPDDRLSALNNRRWNWVQP